MLMTKKKF